MSDINPQITLGPVSSDPERPDYANPTYFAMLTDWQIVEDVRQGTAAMRAKKSDYLPRFDAEQSKSWNTRVALTFASDTYELTLEEHVGMITAEPIKPGDDVPQTILPYFEDFNGEGDSLDIFAGDVLDSAMHFGHAVLWTDLPDTSVYPNRKAKRVAGVRPYAQLYHAPDVIDWDIETVGGSKCITRIVFREPGNGKAVNYREVSQAVVKQEGTGLVVSLGAITWRIRAVEDGKKEFALIDEGVIVGPSKIPVRVVYGGRKKGVLHSSPHLKAIAYTSLEEVQVASDYAAVMHKCNVPTPVFVGVEDVKKVVMGVGVALPVGGSAMYLEPSGVALAATRQRLEDINHQMQRQGATTSDSGMKTLTATEAAMVAKSRNTKLARTAQSAIMGLEGVTEDMFAFDAVTETDRREPKKGTLEINTDFAGVTIDPAYLTVLSGAWKEGALPLDAYLHALQHGRLPEDFSTMESALRLMAELEADDDEPDDTDDELEDEEQAA